MENMNWNQKAVQETDDRKIYLPSPKIGGTQTQPRLGLKNARINSFSFDLCTQ